MLEVRFPIGMSVQDADCLADERIKAKRNSEEILIKQNERLNKT